MNLFNPERCSSVLNVSGGSHKSIVTQIISTSLVLFAIITGPSQHNITSPRLDVEFQPGSNKTSVVVGIVDNNVYGFVDSSLNFRVFILNDDFVKIGPKSRLRIRIFDDEVYTVEIVSFPDLVTEGDDAAAVLVLNFQEPPGGSVVNPRISTIVRPIGGSASKHKYTSYPNTNVLSSVFPLKIYSFPGISDYRPPHAVTRE